MSFKRQKLAREAAKAAGLVTRVLRVRVKDKHAAWARECANAVNTVWNYVNDVSQQMLRREGRFSIAGDLHKLTAGVGKECLPIHSQTVQAVNEEFVTRRAQFRKARLRWRVSNPKRADRSLGWVPFKKTAIAYRNGQVHLFGQPLSLWDSYGLSEYEFGAGSLSEDARGRWYLNITVKVKKQPRDYGNLTTSALGIDLGLKSLMTDSAGSTVEAQRFYRDLEQDIAVAQRARKKARVRALHAKVANRRKDFLHQLSTEQVRRYAAIFVGNVNAAALAQTSMAKSVLDAGWSAYRTMLCYKSDDAGAWFKEIDEAYSTQECSVCGDCTGPKGLEGLSVRRWRCSCGAEHDRDHNSACVIRNRGLAWLVKEQATAVCGTSPATAVNETS
jgi:putative transposase